MKYFKPALIILGILFLDQITKLFARNLFTDKIAIIKNFFYLTLTKNTGAGFSILQGNNLLLMIITFLVTVGLIYYLGRAEKREVVPVSMIIGGAMGNLIDRVFFGGVIDFIQVSIWPVFNIADSAITIGIILYIIMNIKKK